jgi:hypothetical protein
VAARLVQSAASKAADSSTDPLPTGVTWTRITVTGSGAPLQHCFAAAAREGTIAEVAPHSNLTVTGEWLDGSQANCGGTVLYKGEKTGVAVVAGQTTEVTVTMEQDLFTVSTLVGNGGSLSPVGSQSVRKGATQTFSVLPDTGYTVSSVSGCGGTLVGYSYTTGPVTADCEVTATFQKL